MNNDEKMDIQEILKWQKEMMKEHGFYVHGVYFEDTDYMDYHTHGLEKSFNIPELQIVIPVSLQVANIIFRSVIKAIRGSGIPMSNPGPSDPFLLELINGERLLVKFNWVHYTSERIIRIILSDKDLRFRDNDGCDTLYAEQEDFDSNEKYKGDD